MDYFRRAPVNSINNFETLIEYPNETPALNDIDDGGAQASEILDSIQGVLVDFPLEFLKDEWFHPTKFENCSAEEILVKVDLARAFT